MTMTFTRRGFGKALAVLAAASLAPKAALAASTPGPGEPFFKIPDIMVFFEEIEGDPAKHYLSVRLMVDLMRRSDYEFFRVNNTQLLDMLKLAFRGAGFEALNGPDGPQLIKRIAADTIGKIAGAPPIRDVLIINMTIL